MNISNEILFAIPDLDQQIRQFKQQFSPSLKKLDLEQIEQKLEQIIDWLQEQLNEQQRIEEKKRALLERNIKIIKVLDIVTGVCLTSGTICQLFGESLMTKCGGFILDGFAAVAYVNKIEYEIENKNLLKYLKDHAT